MSLAGIYRNLAVNGSGIPESSIHEHWLKKDPFATTILGVWEECTSVKNGLVTHSFKVDLDKDKQTFKQGETSQL